MLKVCFRLLGFGWRKKVKVPEENTCMCMEKVLAPHKQDQRPKLEMVPSLRCFDMTIIGSFLIYKPSYLEFLEPVVTAKSNYSISPLKKLNDHLKTAFYLLALAMGGDHNRTPHREQKSLVKTLNPQINPNSINLFSWQLPKRRSHSWNPHDVRELQNAGLCLQHSTGCTGENTPMKEVLILKLAV